MTLCRKSRNAVSGSCSLFLLLAILLLFTACKDQHIATVNNWPFINEEIYELMHNYYLWQDHVPVSVNLESYSTPQSLIDDMSYDLYDRWSMVMDYSDYEDDFIEGSTASYGVYWNYDSNGEPRLLKVDTNSPAGQAGLQRGDLLNYWNPDTGLIIISNNDSSLSTNYLTSASYYVNAVLHEAVIETNGHTVGYVVLEQFLATAEDEIISVFDRFQSSNVTTVIMDLRYNGGGYLSFAATIADYLAPSSAQNEVFYRLTYNNNTSWSDELCYIDKKGTLELDSVYFITTGYSASASELLINGLKPLMDVYTVGTETHGKPVGMNGFNYGSDYIVFPVTFYSYNKNDEGEYFSGLSVSKGAVDDIRYNWGESNDPCLQAALEAIVNSEALTEPAPLTDPVGIMAEQLRSPARSLTGRLPTAINKIYNLQDL
ncbi:MAG TPA: S41 family peptidase [Spirochaetota bacterium]|nr:S41 family peptidase [Spirochaetota bacterium]